MLSIIMKLNLGDVFFVILRCESLLCVTNSKTHVRKESSLMFVPSLRLSR